MAEIGRGRGNAYDAAVADARLTLFRDKGYAVPAQVACALRMDVPARRQDLTALFHFLGGT